MHCYKCEEEIIATGGTLDIPIYLYDRQVYDFKKAIVIECPKCHELVVILNTTSKELFKTIKVSKEAQTG